MKISGKQITTFVIILIITPIGFYTKFYEGPFQEWVNNYSGGVLYVIFWNLVVFLLFPDADKLKIVFIVFIATSLLEALQLWHPPVLEAVRSNFIGRTILGNSFNWWDFPHYIAGSALGYFLLNWIERYNK
jgi:hypothetical protein